MKNPFTSAPLRESYDLYISHYIGKVYLFDPNGTRNKGNSCRDAFWKGYDGTANILFAKDTFAYAAYRAGQDCAKHDSGQGEKHQTTQERIAELEQEVTAQHTLIKELEGTVFTLLGEKGALEQERGELVDTIQGMDYQYSQIVSAGNFN